MLTANHEMEFKPIHFADRLRVINVYGTVGIITLWSSVDFVMKRFRDAGIDLNESSSKIAVFGNLYGEGFRYLLRNLLYNPQIDTLILSGTDRSKSADYLPHFFSQGVEPVDINIAYKCADSSSQVRPVRIVGTDYIMDNLVSPELFLIPPLVLKKDASNQNHLREIKEFLQGYQPRSVVGERVHIEAPEVKTYYYPSNVRGHMIIEKSPSTAWKVLVHRIFRFGQKVLIKKGERIELQNVKVVVEEPVFEDPQVIRECGFDPDSFTEFQRLILSPEGLPDASYTYGHRIRKYFGFDCLENVAAQLNEDLDDRKAYISLWDTRNDSKAGNSPCLVSLFFRKQDTLLHLSATFRTHNASQAWLENFYGLMAIQGYVCDRIGTKRGAITVISHSISLDPMYLEKMKPIYDKIAKTNIIRKDPHGYFRISTSGEEIIVQHCLDGGVIGEYRAKKPEKIQHQLYKDHAISDINHAIYIGRQLEKAFHCIQEGMPYVQE